MPQTLHAETSDLEKVLQSLSFLTSIRNLDDLLSVFGLENLPTAQKYGILFGCLVFTITITTVFTLLVLGGSFKRIAQQAETGETSIPDSIEERVGRPLLLERLLEAQERMVKRYPEERRGEGMTPLMKLLLNVAPDVKKAKEVMATLVEEDEETKKKKNEEMKKFIPDGYEENYVAAYRRCQDKPGGATMSGLPEARFEAYARSYAGCSPHSTTAYRRSYGRMHEAVACTSHSSEASHRNHWLSRPGDIIGRTVRLEPLEASRHLEEFHSMTCGNVYREHTSFDPHQVWAFWPEGPFRRSGDVRDSFVFQRYDNEAGFAIVESLTDRMIGVVMLTNDTPRNLSISLELPIVKPSSDGTVESIEGCFLLLDRLFSLGYRRIQMSIDSMDTNGKKLAGRLGFTQEGMIPKDRVVKESNRDSVIYGMLNSDWDKGARAFLYKKLHGEKAMKADVAMNKREEEIEHRQRVLDEAKEKEKEADDGKAKK